MSVIDNRGRKLYLQLFDPFDDAIPLWVNGKKEWFEKNQLSEPIRLNGHLYRAITNNQTKPA